MWALYRGGSPVGVAELARGRSYRPAVVTRFVWDTALRNRLWIESAAVSLFAGVIYLLTMARVYGETDDGLYAAVQVRDGELRGLLVPSHIAYNCLGWVWHNATSAIGFEGGALASMQLLDVVLGATGIGILWAFLRTATNLLVACVACGALAFSYGFWFYSVSVEVYVLSTLLLLLCFIAAVRAAMAPSVLNFAVLGMANGLAVLGHTTNVLFAGVVLVALVVASKKGSEAAGVVRFGLAYGMAVALVVLPVYGLAVVSLGLSTPREVYVWYTEITRSGDWGALSTSSLPKALVGAGRALLGGHVYLAIPEVQQAGATHLGLQNPREEVYLVREVSEARALLLLLPGMVLLAGIGASLLAWARRPQLPERGRVIAWLCLAWLGTYVPFFVWWEPLNIEFWIATLVPAAILLALPLSALCGDVRVNRLRAGAAVFVLASLLLVNLAGSVWPQRDQTNDYWRARVNWYEENARQSDVVLTAGHLWSPYVAYFSPAQVIDVFAVLAQHDGDKQAAVAEINQLLEAMAPTRVLISSEVFYPGAYEVSCCADATGASGIGGVILSDAGERLDLLHRGDLEWVWQVAR